jgi:hypothetical protein
VETVDQVSDMNYCSLLAAPRIVHLKFGSLYLVSVWIAIVID